MSFSNCNLPRTRRSFLKDAGLASAAVVASSLPIPAIAQPQEINIISAESNSKTVAALKSIADAFSKEAGTTVVVNNMDSEAHKTAIRNYLVAGAPDVCFWFSGNRMRAFVKRGLFEDISDLMEKESYKNVLGSSVGSVTVDGKQYGLPTGGNLWGMFYRKDVFDQHGLTVPTTTEEFATYCDKAKAAGITPLALGTKALWPAAGFFDQLNLRINGLEKHMELMDGKMSYLDPALTPVFDQWEAMIKKEIFTPNHTSFGWQEAAALLAQKKAGMMNLAAFLRAAFTAADLPQLQFAPFPTLAPNVGRFEDFSLNSVHIPTNGKNKQGAREFLAYFYKPENLAAYLEPAGYVPPRNDLPPSKDPLVNAAVESMKSVQGSAQYYDRDSDPDMAQAGLVGFQEFMVKPDRRKDILLRLEATRKRIYKI